MRNSPLRLSALCALAAASAAPAAADEPTINDLIGQGKFCSATAQAVFRACGNQTLDDYYIGLGVCINESNSRERADCLQELTESRDDAREECAAQRDARSDLCEVLGEGRYDPAFAPPDFDRDFHTLTNPNPYFPLAIGDRWEFRSATETNVVRVTGATKLVGNVRCLVVRDEVFVDGVLTEGTNDWFAQAKDGSVWYCGEETAEFETFEGDGPMKPELVSIEGSFKADRDGAKPGIIFLANPRPGQTYIEESSLGNAEDTTMVIVTDYSYGKYPGLDQLVPAQLARLLCANNCVVTRNTSPLEPDDFERKYYAPGIGVFLETAPKHVEVNRLVKCNVDPRCSQLPP